MKTTRIYTLLALMLFFGAKSFAQEWEYANPYQMTDSVMIRQYCAYEISDGRIIVSASFLYNDGTNKGFYPPHNALIALSPNGDELAQTGYFRPGYWGSSYNPYVFENENGEVFALMSYSPDHNQDYFNYFLNYDNPPTDAILGLYKLNDNLEIVDSFEYSFPVDIADGQSNYSPCEASGSIHIHSAILDEGNIVGAYTKNVSKDNDSVHGQDSLFFFRMSFEGELLANVGYEIPYSGQPWQMLFWREQLVKTDSGYIYYANWNNIPPSPEYVMTRDYAGTVAYLDNDLNLVRTRALVHPGGNGNGQFLFDDISVMRSNHNTTYLSTRTSRYYDPNYDDCFLYEMDDDLEGTQNIVPVIREIVRGVADFDYVAPRAVDVDGDNVYFCYSLKMGFVTPNDSWVVIEKLDGNFNTITEVYYGTDSDRIWHCAESIILTNDGGVLLTVDSKKLDDLSQRSSAVVKFPAEAFVGIAEAHDNGLKMAIAYPNPGKDVLNIRTGLKDARVEVYDMSGRMVCGQEITENVTSISAEGWPAGAYVWKVYSGVSTSSTTLVETGKWIKE